MTGLPRACPKCSSPLGDQAKFCGQCGFDLTGFSTAPLEDGPTEVTPMQPAVEGRPPTAAGTGPAQPTSPSPAQSKKTVMGLPGIDPLAVAAERGIELPAGLAVATTEPAPAPAAAPAPVQPPTSAESPPKRPENRTMLGMTAPQMPPGIAPPAAGAVPTPQQSVHQPMSAQAEPPAPTGAGPASPNAPPSPQSNRTMLGLVAPQAPDTPGIEPPAPAPRPTPGPSNRTMLGQPAPPMPQPQERKKIDTLRPRAAVHYGETYAEDVERYRRTKQKSSGLLIGLLIVGALLFFGAVGTAVVLYVTGDGPSLSASVVQTEEGERLRVQLPGAADGTRIRFEGREAPLEDGAATFEIASDDLQIGDNDLAFEVLGPNGEGTPGNVTLTVSYRVRANLEPLAGESPALEIVADALPGSTATIDGEPVALDERGHGVRRVALAEAGSETAFEHSATYRIQLPDGEAHEGTVRTRVQFTAIRIDRPGSELVTESADVEIAGLASDQAAVTIDGVAVQVDAGRFTHRYALANVGTYRPAVIASQPGRAPRRVTLEIRRVADLRAEAASFAADSRLTYARIQSDANSYRGRRVALEGRVYNVDANEGALQILVRDCPGGQRCPLWVSYPGAPDVTVHSWVRVLGTVGGEQQFRSQSNEVRTVPRVDAVFVLPVAR